MLHRLRVGHFDREALARGEFVITAPLEAEALQQAMDASGAIRLDDEIVLRDGAIRCRDGFLDCPWMSPRLNVDVVDFIRRLHDLTDCVIFEHLATGELSVDQLGAGRPGEIETKLIFSQP